MDHIAQEPMETKFAPAERLTGPELDNEIAIVSKNPIMTGLLNSVSGLLAVLNEHRQIIAINSAFLKLIGIDDPASSFGLRPGEVLHCVHACDEPGGCGTSEYCSTCGAALAIVTSLVTNEPVERQCALETDKNGKRDIVFKVQAHPLNVEGKRYILLFLQDITLEEQRAALERTFFHDVNNLLGMLIGASDVLQVTNPSEISKSIQDASLRLASEMKIQRCLSKGNATDYKVTVDESTIGHVLKKLADVYTLHPVAESRTLDISDACSAVAIKTDLSLLSRVLCNMITNAFEGTGEGGTIKVWAEVSGEMVTFNVWNDQVIPEDYSRRVFQRNYSTKGEPGRGVGTFSMKLFGEEVLGGKVGFRSSEDNGTVFYFQLPLSPCN